MKQLYFSSTLMWGATPEEVLGMAARWGLGGVEIWAQQADTFGWDADQIARLAAANHLQMVVHAKSWDLNFAALNEGVRRASIEELKKSLVFAQHVGAQEMTLHPPRFTLPSLREQAIEAGREGLAELLDTSDQVGVPISLEVMEKIPKELVTTVEEYQTFIGFLAPRLTCTLDMAHCRSAEEFWDYAERLPRISKLHISNKQGTKLHTPLPLGDYDFVQQLPHLKRLGVPMVIEGFDQDPRFEIVRSDLALCQIREEKNA